MLLTSQRQQSAQPPRTISQGGPRGSSSLGSLVSAPVAVLLSHCHLLTDAHALWLMGTAQTCFLSLGNGNRGRRTHVGFQEVTVLWIHPIGP